MKALRMAKKNKTRQNGTIIIVPKDDAPYGKKPTKATTSNTRKTFVTSQEGDKYRFATLAAFVSVRFR